MAKTMTVAFKSNSKDLARQYHWRAERMRMSMQGACVFNGELLVRTAQEMSSLDDHSLADLARMGHPYGHGRTPPHPPRFIHRQRGNFWKRWFYKVVWDGDAVQVILGNTARTGKGGLALLSLLEFGTKWMIPRGVLSYVIRSKKREIELNIRRAYRASMGLHGAAARSRAYAYLAGLER